MLLKVFAITLLWLITAPHTESAAAQDVSRLLNFEDSALEGPGVQSWIPSKPWKAWEKKVIIAAFLEVYRKAPGLVERASMYRPITLYRTDGEPGLEISVAAGKVRPVDNAVYIFDPLFSHPDKSRPAMIVTHELVHLVDIAYVLESSPEWIRLVKARLERARQGLKDLGMGCETYLPLSPEQRSAGLDVVHNEGVPTQYACHSLSEALAEYATAVIYGYGKVPEPIRNYVVRHLLSHPNSREQYLEAVHTGLAAFGAGATRDAITSFTQAIELKPDANSLYFFRALAAEQLGEHRRAIEDYDQVLRLDPGYAFAYNSRGVAYGKLGDYRRAIEDYDQAIALSPLVANYYKARGTAYFELADLERARADFEKAITLDPTDQSARNNLAFFEVYQHGDFGLLVDKDFFGNDLYADGVKSIELGACAKLCAQSNECAGFTYLTELRWCWPKSVVGAPSPHQGALSAIKRAQDVQQSETPEESGAQVGSSEPPLPPVRLPGAEYEDTPTGDKNLPSDATAPMSRRFAVFEGREDAPNRLVFVHSAEYLGIDYRVLNEATLYRMIDSGELRVDHYFALMGPYRSLLGNLALICAGSEGFRSVRTALATPTGGEALAGLEDWADIEGFKAFLRQAYSSARLNPGLVESCVFDRDFQTAFVNEYSEKSGEQDTLIRDLDSWPIFILNGTSIPIKDIEKALQALSGRAMHPSDESRLNEPAQVAAFFPNAVKPVPNRYFEIPRPGPRPGPHPDIRMGVLMSGSDLVEVGNLANLPDHVLSRIRLICDRGSYIVCSLRHTVPYIHERLELLGLERPANYSHRFYAPQKFSSTLFDDETRLFCELDNENNLYVFDGHFRLRGLAKLGLAQVFPRTAPTDLWLWGCEMDPSGNVYVALGESIISGADGVLVKFSPEMRSLVWVTPRMTANSGAHFTNGRLFTAHGGSGIDDFLFEIDPESGQVIGREPVPTAVE